MVRLTCVNCGAEYDDQRFIWEEEQHAAVAAFAEGSPAAQPDVDVALDTCSVASSDSSTAASSTDKWMLSPGSDDEGDVIAAHDARSEDKLNDFLETSLQDTSLRWDSSAGPPAPSLLRGSEPGKSRSQGRAIYCDVVRTTGTAAKITGMVAPAASMACGTVSVIGSSVGVASGAAQLQDGLSTPSGVVDPHLLAKGSVTTSIGLTNVCLCAKASIVASPVLFGVALGLSVLNSGASTAIDATVPGLCGACRCSPPKGAVALSSHGVSDDFEKNFNKQYESEKGEIVSYSDQHFCKSIFDIGWFTACFTRMSA